MDFDDTDQERAWRAEVRAWLCTRAKLRTDAAPRAPVIADADADTERRHVLEAKEWQRQCYDDGWAGITWPKEYGGRGGSPAEQIIFDQEIAAFDVPAGVFAQGIGMAGPTIIAEGTEAQKQRYLRPMLRGDEVWCQLFSEPGAGSDLAAISTRAVADGESFVVTGHKVWTSSAHFSDWGILLARTTGGDRRHTGLTYFLLDMSSPGLDVRPLRQITGASHFNEVFLDEVRIPAEQVVGPVDEGWRVAMTTLTNERTFIGVTSSALGSYEALAALAHDRGVADNPTTRQGLAQAYIRGQILRYLGWRAQTAVSQRRAPGPESSLLKLGLSRHLAASADLAMAIGGPGAMVFDYVRPEASSPVAPFLGQWASRLGGGTEQIQANIVGERVLGLPREPRPTAAVAR
jgi:alkylation response protein AidB-like acyl-CoA dehydrogenase